MLGVNDSDDPYGLLRVPSTITDQKLQIAYRKLALIHHLDRQNTEQEKEHANVVFAKISNVYKILSDPEQLQQYDNNRAYGCNE